MKPLVDVKSFMKALNQLYGTYTGVVLDDSKELFEKIFSIIRKNLKRKSIFRRINVSISCADFLKPNKVYYIKEFEYSSKKNVKFFVEEMINAIPEDVESVFIMMRFYHYNIFESLASQNTVNLVIFQHSKDIN